MRNTGKPGDIVYLDTIEKVINSGFVNRTALENYTQDLRSIPGVGGNTSDLRYAMYFLFDRIENKGTPSHQTHRNMCSSSTK